jgi:phenylalanyl-tRNA synthetase alpha chain
VIDDIRAARDAALVQVEHARTLDEVRALDTRLLGKSGPLAAFKKQLGSLATVDEKKAAGQAVNEAMQAVTAALAAREAELVPPSWPTGSPPSGSTSPSSSPRRPAATHTS